jgi:1,4-dihydroxy-2-naphthoate polyprenyltransferase
VATAALPRWKIWFMAVRPWSLPISIIPILVGSALAWQDGQMSWPFAILMLLLSVMTHIGTNLTNDYFDHIHGVDAMQEQGPGRMLQKGHLSDRDLRNGMIVSFGLALALGIPTIVHLGWMGVVFAVLGAGVAFFYTGGPWPLAYNRLGELGVFVAMGWVMVMGSYFVHTGTVTIAAFLLATAIGMYAAAILHANNARDAEVDKQHRKHTLANTFGRQWAVREYTFFVLAPVGLTILLIALRPDYWPLLGGIVVVPIAFYNIELLKRARNEAEGTLVVASTTRLHMRYGTYVIAGLILKGVMGL